MKKCYTIDLIFNIQAQFKNPLLIKPKTQSLGFYGEKNFYSVQKDFKLPDKKKSLRVFEYDLHNFEKIRVQDLTNPQFLDFDKDFKKRGLIGKVKEGGFYRIFSQVNKDNAVSMHILKGNEIFDLDPFPKPNKFLEHSNLAQPVPDEKGNIQLEAPSPSKTSNFDGKKTADNKAQGRQYIAISEKGDKVLVLRIHDEAIKLVRYVQDNTAQKTEGAHKKFKVDSIPLDNK